MSSIIQHINFEAGKIFDSFKSFDEAAAVLPKETIDDMLIFLPCIIHEDGSIEYTGHEDEEEVIVYHRLMGITPRLSNQQFGRGTSRYIMTKEYSMVVFVDLVRVQKTIEELAISLLSCFPVQTTVSQINTNSMQVFQEEFNGSQFYFLNPEQAMIRISYTMEGNA